MKKPEIYDYLDYRVYLRELYAYLKATERGFSYRKFALRAGYKAPNNLKRVIDGQRQLTGESIARFAQGLRMNRTEAEYFEALVCWNQATDASTRKHYEAVVRRRATAFRGESLTSAAYDYLSSLVNVVVREAVNRSGAAQTPAAIRKGLYFPVKTAEIERALGVLRRLKLIRKRGSRYEQAHHVLQTDDEMADLAAKEYHSSAMAWAAQTFERVPRQERLLGGVTASISERRLRELREFLTVQRHQLAAFLSEDDGEPVARVVQINYQMFPVTRPLAEGRDA